MRTPYETKRFIILNLKIFAAREQSLNKTSENIFYACKEGRIFNGWSFLIGVVSGILILHIAIVIFV